MIQAFRASLLDFIADPVKDENTAYRYVEDGLLLVEHGKVIDSGEYSKLKIQLSDHVVVRDYQGKLIMPGFIDLHVHYAQTDMIASHGTQLLDWLNHYTYPIEKRFSNPEIADDAAQFFIQQLLANGTTSAMVFATVHTQSVKAIFDAAQHKQMRLISGKVMMDRNAPTELLDTPQSSYDDSKALIFEWHKNGRLQYALTPRFAPTSSEEQMRIVQQLMNEHPDVYLQSHVAENQGEVAWVKQLFPWSRSYLDVYDHFDLLSDRSIFAHCIYLDKEDLRRMAESGAAVAFCPTANLFLGSGLFDMQAALKHSVSIGIGSDVGAGTSLNMLKTVQEAYKVGQLKGYNLSPLQALYWLTLGAAKILSLDQNIGNFIQGKEADFVVLNWAPTQLMRRRMSVADNLQEQLFALMVLGDERNIHATYVLGKNCYQNNQYS